MRLQLIFEVKDPGFMPSVLAQNPDHLFTQATQFRLRSQITAELVALLSLPSDQVTPPGRPFHRVIRALYFCSGDIREVAQVPDKVGGSGPLHSVWLRHADDVGTRY